jgi:hypothetical protein
MRWTDEGHRKAHRCPAAQSRHGLTPLLPTIEFARHSASLCLAVKPIPSSRPCARKLATAKKYLKGRGVLLFCLRLLFLTALPDARRTPRLRSLFTRERASGKALAFSRHVDYFRIVRSPGRNSLGEVDASKQILETRVGAQRVKPEVSL